MSVLPRKDTRAGSSGVLLGSQDDVDVESSPKEGMMDNGGVEVKASGLLNGDPMNERTTGGGRDCTG